MAKKAEKILTPKQEQFCLEYLIDLNGSQAAIRAGYSKKTAQEQSSRLLSNVKVRERIAGLKASRVERTGIEADEVINELKKVGFSNIQDFLQKDNQILDISGVKRELAAAVESVEVDKAGKVKLKLYNKLNALTDLGRHIGLFEKDNKQRAEGAILFINGLEPVG